MKIIKITRKKITYDNGSTIKYYHEQECCENVYADFKALGDTDIMEVNFEEIDIEDVENAGFRLNGYFVPCYNEQNGYYSDDLKLIIKRRNNSKKYKKEIIWLDKEDIDC